MVIILLGMAIIMVIIILGMLIWLEFFDGLS